MPEDRNFTDGYFTNSSVDTSPSTDFNSSGQDADIGPDISKWIFFSVCFAVPIMAVLAITLTNRTLVLPWKRNEYEDDKLMNRGNPGGSFNPREMEHLVSA